MTKLDWIAHPTELYGLLYGMLAAGLCLCLFLFFTLKLEFRAAERRSKIGGACLAGEIAALRSAFDSMREKLHGLQERPVLPGPLPPDLSGVNLGKLCQMLQTNWQQRSPDEITASLSSSKADADLLIKVHQMMLELLR